MKSALTRITYVTLLCMGTYLIINGHLNKKYNRIILGFGVLVSGLFFSHYPISFITRKEGYF